MLKHGWWHHCPLLSLISMVQQLVFRFYKVKYTFILFISHSIRGKTFLIQLKKKKHTDVERKLNCEIRGLNDFRFILDIFLNLLKANDDINHDILLLKQTYFCVCRTPLKCFDCCFRKWKFFPKQCSLRYQKDCIWSTSGIFTRTLNVPFNIQPTLVIPVNKSDLVFLLVTWLSVILL